MFASRYYILVLATLVSASIVYYFAYALPEQNKQKIEIERQKVISEQQKAALEQQRLDIDREKNRIEQAQSQELINNANLKESQRALNLEACTNRAVEEADNYLSLNGKPTKYKGVYKAPQYILDKVDEMKRTGIEDCTKLYGR
jgi:hypothetical protein